LFERLLPEFDVLVENFRPGTLDQWGLSSERLHAIHPNLITLRLTGFGQTGPYRDKPGFARVFESLSGFTYLCGEAGGSPLHMGFPISDAVAGLFGAIGILSAVNHRLNHPDAPGQEIDLSATEAMFRLLDFLPIEYDQLGTVRERSGNSSQYAGPSNIYRTRDHQWASIAASTQSIFERLAHAMARADLITDRRFATNPQRVKQVFDDPQFKAREAIVTVHDNELGAVRMQNVVPRFSATPGVVRNAGPKLGEHNDEVYGGVLGLSPEERAQLLAEKVI